MRILVLGVVAAAAVAACQPDSDKTNPAVATEEAQAEREAAAPAAGASSFTEDQARGRITDAGYTGVTALTQTADGAWQGTAQMNGQSVSIIVDYQGNVTPAPSTPTAPADPAAQPSPTEGTTP